MTQATPANPSDAAPNRRTLRFESVEQALAEVERLRRGGYRRAGQWSLPQACCHLSRVIEQNLTPPPSDEPTAEETATKERFFGMVFGPGGMPPNIPLAADQQPPADAGDAEYDRFAAALAELDSYEHPCVKIGRCGPVPIDQVRRLHLAHAAHHLSFLIPAADARPVGRDV